MMAAIETGILSKDEWLLVNTLRDLPPSPLRDRFLALLGELLGFVADPGCTEMQADGVPCASPQAACDQCRRVTDLLDALRSRLQRV
jgi:hypothetical protein